MCDALCQAGDQKDQRGENAYTRKCRGEGDHDAAAGGDEHSKRESFLAANTVRIEPEDEPAQRPGQESGGEDGQRCQKGCGRIVRRKELQREIRCEDRVDRPVEPLERVAKVDREDVLQSSIVGTDDVMRGWGRRRCRFW